MNEMEKIPNLIQLKQICQPTKVTSRAVEHWYGRYYRWVDLRVTWLLLHLKFITANQVTGFCLALSAFGGFVLLLPGYYGVIAFLLVFQLWVILDGVDGEIARYQKRFSMVGIYLDLLSHFFIYLTIFIPLGFELFFKTNNVLYLTLGFIVAILGIACNLPGIARKVTIFKEKPELKNIAPQKSDSRLINLYRVLISPMEISLMIVAILLAEKNFTALKNHEFSLYFMAFYCILFTYSFFANLNTSKKMLDKMA